MPRAPDKNLIATFGAVLAGRRGTRGLTQEALTHEAGWIARSWACWRRASARDGQPIPYGTLRC